MTRREEKYLALGRPTSLVGPSLPHPRVHDQVDLAGLPPRSHLLVLLRFLAYPFLHLPAPPSFARLCLHPRPGHHGQSSESLAKGAYVEQRHEVLQDSYSLLTRSARRNLDRLEKALRLVALRHVVHDDLVEWLVAAAKGKLVLRGGCVVGQRWRLRAGGSIRTYYGSRYHPTLAGATSCVPSNNDTLPAVGMTVNDRADAKLHPPISLVRRIEELTR